MTMTIARVLTAVQALTVVSCVSDFSPDPYNKLSSPAASADAGAKDASVKTGTGSANSGGTSGLDSEPTGDSIGDDSGAPVSTGGSDSDAGRATAPAGPCDLSGRWIMTEYSTSSALGALQLALQWFYVDMTQQGDDITMTKTLYCGGSVNEAPGQLFTINEDDSAAWPAYQKMSNYNGRKGTSKSSSNGCDVAFEQATLVRGCTVDTYKDVSIPLPEKDQPANGSTPGWEDWDMDGYPGVSMVVTKSATNTLFSAFRTFGTYQGSIAQGAKDFSLVFDWDQNRTVLGSLMPDPAGILTTPASRDADDSVNFAEFARLADNQATGSDDDICNAIRMLAPTLNPKANAK